MKLIGVMGNGGSGKTTFSEYLGTKQSVGVIHVDELTGEVKKKYFRPFLQSKEKNNTDTTRSNPKLRPGAKAIFYRSKLMFGFLMNVRNTLIKKELNKRIDDFKKQGKSLVIIDDWAITTQKDLLPRLSHLYYIHRDYGERRNALRQRDNMTIDEAKLADLPYALKFIKAPRPSRSVKAKFYKGLDKEIKPKTSNLDPGVEITYISNKGSIEDLYEKAEKVYKLRGELSFDERYSLRGKVNFRDVAITLGRIKDVNDKERKEKTHIDS